MAFADNKGIATLHETGGFGVSIGFLAAKRIRSSLSAIGSIGCRQIGYLQTQRLRFRVIVETDCQFLRWKLNSPHAS